MSSVDDAKLDLVALDIITTVSRMCGDPGWDNRVAVEAAKAVSLAVTHSGIESRIICRNSTEAHRALAVIYSHETRKRENAKWDVVEAGLELPNGSIVVVMLDGKKVVPK